MRSPFTQWCRSWDCQEIGRTLRTAGGQQALGEEGEGRKKGGGKRTEEEAGRQYGPGP